MKLHVVQLTQRDPGLRVVVVSQHLIVTPDTSNNVNYFSLFYKCRGVCKRDRSR